MSSKQNHINITRENYEEFFMLYIDNELTAEENTAVETFAMLHPDLGEELELLRGTKLEPGTFSFAGKSELLSENIRAGSVDESLLLYIDDELDADEKKRVSFEIGHNPAYNKQYQQLRSLKLDPNDTITCDFKEELYRKEESKRPLPWLRIAAAVILLIGAGSLIIRNNKETILPVAATGIKKTPVKDQQVVPEVVTPTQQVLASDDQRAIRKAKTRAQEEETVIPRQDIIEDQQIAYAPSTVADNTNNTVANNSNNTEIAATGNENIQRIRVVDFNRNKQIINDYPVTNTVTPASNLIAATMPASDAGINNSDGKQASVRGLLRKATRFIERRTGINPVNDDDKLLVGMVAISLK